jgi:hypothetical protein
VKNTKGSTKKQAYLHHREDIPTKLPENATQIFFSKRKLVKVEGDSREDSLDLGDKSIDPIIALPTLDELKQTILQATHLISDDHEINNLLQKCTLDDSRIKSDEIREGISEIIQDLAVKAMEKTKESWSRYNLIRGNLPEKNLKEFLEIDPLIPEKSLAALPVPFGLFSYLIKIMEFHRTEFIRINKKIQEKEFIKDVSEWLGLRKNNNIAVSSTSKFEILIRDTLAFVDGGMTKAKLFSTIFQEAVTNHNVVYGLTKEALKESKVAPLVKKVKTLETNYLNLNHEMESCISSVSDIQRRPPKISLNDDSFNSTNSPLIVNETLTTFMSSTNNRMTKLENKLNDLISQKDNMVTNQNLNLNLKKKKKYRL